MSSGSESLQQLISMGFAEDISQRALNRTKNDISEAVELLSTGRVDEPVDEFDMLPADPGPDVNEPTVYNSQDHVHRAHPGGEDPFKEGLEDPTPAEMFDGRISMFTEMGFSATQAEDALKACNNDINEALSMLSGSG